MSCSKYSHIILKCILIGSDYIICNGTEFGTVNFTVYFNERQRNSSVAIICIVDDNVAEGSEFFQLRICDIRTPPGTPFMLVPGYNDTIAQVEIEDDDGECYR